jgi:hypothetical protein
MIMGIMRPQNDKMKPIAMAVGGSIIAAVATMFVPTHILESITGATGLSELVHATAAPLGDTARALIAFGTGAVTLIILLAFTMRSSEPKEYAAPRHSEPYDHIGDGADRLSGLKERLGQINMPKMPWTRGEDDILDLADLPKLRSNDAHPDAPPRRPISVLNDIENHNPQPLDEPYAQPMQEPEAITFPSHEVMVETVTEEFPVAQSAAPAYEAPVATQSYANPLSLAEMVAQMEAAVEQRKQQLEALEKVAAEMTTNKSYDLTNVAENSVTHKPLTQTTVASSLVEQPNVDQHNVDQHNVEMSVIEQQASLLAVKPVRKRDNYLAERPPLEAVPSEPRAQEDDDMDAALNAALATLQRMNSGGS